jgi:hypothetical protein
MIKINITGKERSALNYERYHNPHPKIKRRMEALYLSETQGNMPLGRYFHYENLSGWRN